MLRFLLLLIFTSSLLATEESAPEPTTTNDPGISSDTLKLKLLPLTAEEIAVEAEAWRDLLKEKTTEISGLRIAGESADSPKVTALSQEQEKLIERLGLVLDGWESKGGDVTAMRSYLTALRESGLDLKNPDALGSSVRIWLESEDGARKWAINIAIFIVIVAISWLIASFAGRMAGKAMRKHKRSSELLDRFVIKLVRRSILAAGIIIALSFFDVKVGALVALIGGGAFILGFALQDSLSNFANGVMLMLFQPFDVGDAVEVAGVSGSVDSVSLVNTTIRSFDNKIIIVPNKAVWGQVITNITGSDTRRVDMVFGIGYDDDIEKARSILEKLVAEHELVLDDPEPVIRMHELADSSVNFICRPWAKTSDYWAVHWDITLKVKEEFDAAGISIPYPQQDVHIHQSS